MAKYYLNGNRKDGWVVQAEIVVNDIASKTLPIKVSNLDDLRDVAAVLAASIAQRRTELRELMRRLHVVTIEEEL